MHEIWYAVIVRGLFDPDRGHDSHVQNHCIGWIIGRAFLWFCRLSLHSVVYFAVKLLTYTYSICQSLLLVPNDWSPFHRVLVYVCISKYLFSVFLLTALEFKVLRSQMHFALAFVEGERQKSNLTLLCAYTKFSEYHLVKNSIVCLYHPCKN